MHIFMNGLSSLPLMNSGKSRAINAENPRGEKGAGGQASSILGKSRKGAPCLPEIKPGETAVLAEIDGPGIIQHIWFTVINKTSDRNPFVLRDLVLRMYWDDEENPSVESPLGDFFCCGFGQSYTVNSMPIAVNPSRGLNSYFALPFRKKARITLENQNEEPIPSFFYHIDYCLYDELPAETAYFHAQWRRQAITEKGVDYVILDNVRGKGHYIGTFMALSALERYWWGEGEVKFYFDGDTDYPTICGTGLEDYFGGSWSFAGYDEFNNMHETQYCTPFLGYPFHSTRNSAVTFPYHDDYTPAMRSFYRWHILDPIRFEENLKVTVQQIGVNARGLFERQDDVSTVAYWYQAEPHVPFGPLLPRMERWPR
ncbi:glycoside hydrolase family 172 protein [Breznakiella homolactica]|uniref:DUF2961 domain-containing protein n=1 Tax=Breznakiella homolactica TaxID=2798577 RepID=A0A7T7XLC1_9SPIR|nr:glycoside hydrolase family 172 protein [Breznakiella homolactica]QQO08395.1 DUF2961 domain-containing protein [Breznakiella homolactica]